MQPIMSKNVSPQDQDIRDIAIDPTQSFAVNAPAGSGKTGLLTQRVLNLLCLVDQPEEILGITFTRKAAGEMQDRILNALWEAKNNPPPKDNHAIKTYSLAQKVLVRNEEKKWGLLHNPQRLRVTTIDSLCRNITQQLPLASELGAQPQTLENPNIAYLMAIRELFKKSSSTPDLYPHLARLMHHLDNDVSRTENLLSTLLANRDQWLPAIFSMKNTDQAKEYFESVITDAIEDHLDSLRKAFILVGSEFCMLADGAAENLINENDLSNTFIKLHRLYELPPASFEHLELWKCIADFLLTTTGEFRKTVNKNQGFLAGKEGKELKDRMLNFLSGLPEIAPDLRDLLQWVKVLPKPEYNETQWELLESLTKTLPRLSAELLLIFKQLGATDFIQISQAALTALGDDEDPSDIALQLDYRIKHILIDEFQDTSSTQLHLIEKLSRGWQADDGRTLFIVGDGMQSCYGFRNAKVGIFLDARKDGIGTTSLNAVDLCVNFRSQEGIVKWINNVFSYAFPASDDIARGAVKYANSIAYKSESVVPAVETFIVSYEKSDDDIHAKSIAEIQEAQTVAQLVIKSLSDNPNGSIAILVKSRSHLKHIVPALSDANINFQATNIDNLAHRMSILDLRSLAKSILDLTDRISWLAILRAPWIGLSLADLHCLVHYDLQEVNPRLNSQLPLIWHQIKNFALIKDLSEHGRLNLTRIIPLLDSTLMQLGRKSLRTIIEGLWISLGGPACLSDQSELEDTNQFFKLLDTFSHANNITDWDGFDAALESLFAAPQSNADARVQIMTIHKSKGLEFDTVIIPSLHKSPRADSKELLLMLERINKYGDSQLLLSSFAPTGSENDATYTYINDEIKKQREYEATRLLYVGCTRAISKLYLSATLEIKEESVKPPPKQSLLAKIWPQIKDSIIRIDSKKHANAFVNKNNQIPLSRLRDALKMPPFPNNNLLGSFVAVKKLDENSLIELNRPAFDISINRLTRQIGTLIHEALEKIVVTGLLNSISIEKFIDIHYTKWINQLKNKGWNDESCQHACDKIIYALKNIANDTLGKWILNSEHEASAAEIRFIREDQQGIREYIIDRSFISKGTRWIIDYKSSEPVQGEELETFLTRETLTYQPQLLNYSKLIKSIDNTNPIKVGLYFVTLGIFKEIDLSAKPVLIAQQTLF